MTTITQAQIDDLSAMVSEQEQSVSAGERLVFHGQDDAFHKRLCEIAGHGYVWTLIREQKAHMDRVRFLSLSFGAWSAYEDHVAVLDRIRDGDIAGAEEQLRVHLGRIDQILEQVRDTNSDCFDDGA